MPTRPHFRNPLLTVKTDDPDSGGRLRMDIEESIFKDLGNHARIVTYHGREDVTGALILDTAPNGDVQQYLFNHPDTPLHIRAKWGLQLAEGIAYLHSRHVIWADCNPANLLLTSDLDVLLCDFGGSSTSGLPPIVSPGAVYSLPRLELLADPNADIFSFGCVLFEILTQQVPCAGKDFNEVLAHYESAVFPDIPDGTPDVFVDVMRKSWHLKYASSQELFEDMQTAYKSFCVTDEILSA